MLQLLLLPLLFCSISLVQPSEGGPAAVQICNIEIEPLRFSEIVLKTDGKKPHNHYYWDNVYDPKEWDDNYNGRSIYRMNRRVDFKVRFTPLRGFPESDFVTLDLIMGQQKINTKDPDQVSYKMKSPVHVASENVQVASVVETTITVDRENFEFSFIEPFTILNVKIKNRRGKTICESLTVFNVVALRMQESQKAGRARFFEDIGFHPYTYKELKRISDAVKVMERQMYLGVEENHQIGYISKKFDKNQLEVFRKLTSRIQNIRRAWIQSLPPNPNGEALGITEELQNPEISSIGSFGLSVHEKRQMERTTKRLALGTTLVAASGIIVTAVIAIAFLSNGNGCGGDCTGSCDCFGGCGDCGGCSGNDACCGAPWGTGCCDGCYGFNFPNFQTALPVAFSEESKKYAVVTGYPVQFPSTVTQQFIR